MTDTGRGSPTGVVVYDHVMFPRRYHDAIFVGDWSRGRILAIYPKGKDGTYQTEMETFAAGKPLNVTGLDVGPDGGLYFCTGGRGTEGGVYRIVWRGQVPSTVTELGHKLEPALRQPQLNSAYARQKIAVLKTATRHHLGRGAAENCRERRLQQTGTLPRLGFNAFGRTVPHRRTVGPPGRRFRCYNPRQNGLSHGSTSRCDTNAKLEQLLHDRDPVVQTYRLRIVAARWRKTEVRRRGAALRQHTPLRRLRSHAAVGIAAGRAVPRRHFENHEPTGVCARRSGHACDGAPPAKIAWPSSNIAKR